MEANNSIYIISDKFIYSSYMKELFYDIQGVTYM